MWDEPFAAVLRRARGSWGVTVERREGSVAPGGNFDQTLDSAWPPAALHRVTAHWRRSVTCPRQLFETEEAAGFQGFAHRLALLVTRRFRWPWTQGAAPRRLFSSLGRTNPAALLSRPVSWGCAPDAGQQAAGLRNGWKLRPGILGMEART